jgi:NADH-quinone oxidoreductase subunit F
MRRATGEAFLFKLLDRKGGYAALRRALDLEPEGVLREVNESKLLGCGGAAFPTGRKWEAVAQAPVHPHYLICNADESEPGTFKDRILMEADPFAVIEAMTIAALASGCTQGLGKNPRPPMAHMRHCDTPHRTSRGPLPMHLRLAVRVE